MLEATIRVINRQGKLQGDLSATQNYALQWLMTKEIEEREERDKQQLEMYALAANQQTNMALLNHLERERNKEPQEEAVEWVAPESQEEIDAILEDFGAVV